MSAPKKILLVEDDSAMRRFIEVVLSRAGYEATPAKDGLEGLQLALENHYDAVVADAVMPNMSGYDLCRMLRQKEEFKETPFIILSGLETTDGHNLADDYLLKSENLKNELLETLSKFLT